ncbi:MULTISPECIES: ABC-three component system middle component 8 [Myxococcus]|uniref:ABC-three component system middle component 8 n=1 Tax=Myxococcus TaxID=32 RepID=UPI0009432F3D|nr:hypothetical protein [Myxococcus xanthus]
MIRPTKHSHPDRTVVGVSLVLLRRLKTQRFEEYDALRKHVNKVVAGSDVLVLPALNLLFLLGLIEYRPKNDSIEYLGSNETL